MTCAEHCDDLENHCDESGERAVAEGKMTVFSSGKGRFVEYAVIKITKK